MPDSLLPVTIGQKIFFIRGQKIMLSPHLALLYGIQVKALIQAVKRNIERFPADFMFQLTGKEYKILKSQFVTSRWGGPRRSNPYAFTEHGILMLSSVLKSKRAVLVNIQIMRTFVKLRRMLSGHRELLAKIEALEKKYDRQFIVVFEAVKKLMLPTEKPKTKIGFVVNQSS